MYADYNGLIGVVMDLGCLYMDLPWEYHSFGPSQIGDDPHVDVICMEYCRYTLVVWNMNGL